MMTPLLVLHMLLCWNAMLMQGYMEGSLVQVEHVNNVTPSLCWNAV